MIRISICGATGYSGGELLRLLARRKDVQVCHVTSESSPGQLISSIHRDLTAYSQLRFKSLNPKVLSRDSDVVFSCYPSGVGIKPNAFFIREGVKVVDLSADFRLPDVKMYRTWYGKVHGEPQLLKESVYGLPELFRDEVRTAKLVANPGCYATAALLAAAPLLKKDLVEPKSLIIDAKSGVSGAGKKTTLEYMFVEVNENMKAYSVCSHRHQPEMETVLTRWAGKDVRITFTPHLIPASRGILCVVYAALKRNLRSKDVWRLYSDLYGDEPFVRLLPEGEFPQTKNVNYTNMCDIGVAVDTHARRVVVVSAIDNLVKGAAGQAVQNMNLMFDLPETEGLI